MFITFEGIDGCGKSTQLQLFRNELIARKYDVVTVRDPGDTEISEKIREILLNVNHNINSITELFLFEAARANLVENVILPAIQNNAFVLSDRFCDSTVVYQGYGRGISLQVIDYLNNVATFNFKPALTFFLDVPLEITLARKSDVQKDRMEAVDIDFLQRAINGYKEIAKNEPQRVITIDATGSKNEIANKIIKYFDEFINT